MSSTRQVQKKDHTRQALISAATRLFAERGIYQTTIDDITEAADLGKGTFYKHFGSREEMVAATLRRGFDLLLAHLAEQDDNASDLATFFLMRHLAFFEQHPDYLLLFHQARGWLKLLQEKESPIREEFRRYLSALETEIAKSYPQRRFSEQELQNDALLIAGSISGALSFGYTLGGGLPLTPELRNQLLSQLRAILPPPSLPLAASTPSPRIFTSKPAAEPKDGATWSHEHFFAEAADWMVDLGQNLDLETLRSRVLERINRNHFATYSDDDDRHDLDRVIVRDCVRVGRSLLHPRSERLAGFSLLGTLQGVAHGYTRSDLSPAFWAELCHLVRGIEGRVRLHESADPWSQADLSGRGAATLRSDTLDDLGATMLAAMAKIASGLDEEALLRRASQATRLQKQLGGNKHEWFDWRWQLKHIAKSEEALAAMAALSDAEKLSLRQARDMGIPLGITPYYAALFDEKPDGARDRALRAQVIPPPSYIAAFGTHGGASDFMLEADTSPIDLVTRRYATIAILKPYNSCPQICVYCQRNWEIQGPLQVGAQAGKDSMAAALAWLAEHPTVHEVLITGGDPLMLSDLKLKKLLDGLAALPHIERIRIGTRMPVTLPMRFTPALCKLLQSYRVPGRREVCLVTHVEHPYELTLDFVNAVNRLRKAGIPVYNQLVYTFFVSRRFEAAKLRRLLRRCGVDPYYTFYPKGKDETLDYRVPIARLLQEQKEEARLLPGLARTDEAVFNVPGLGKNYLNAWQHRDLIGIRPDGARLYEFHPWEKKIVAQSSYVGEDVPLLDYLLRLKAIGEDPRDYQSIWTYF